MASKNRPAVVMTLLGAAALTLSPRAVASTAQVPEAVSVSRTFNNSPFTYRIESRAEKTGYSLYRLTYPSPVVTQLEQNNTIPAEYYLPDDVGPGDPKRPAVICLHILEGDFELARMTCSVLALHGIPAIMFKLPYYGERGLPGGPRVLASNPELFVSALSQALEDVRRTIDVLASRPEVDPQRIGITGISLGGIAAATAAAIDQRLSRAALILAGGDLKTIVHHARETRQLSDLIKRLPAQQRARVEGAIQAVDPLRHADRLRARAQRGKVLMVNAAEDEVIPRACSEKLACALGIADDVIWLDGLGHYTALAELPRVLQTTVAFFAEDLPPGLRAAPTAAGTSTALEVVASLIRQAAAFLVSEPEKGRCHFVDLELAVAPKGGETIEGRLRFIRGSQGKFKLECQLPVVGHAALGQSNFPWMASGGRVVFKGVSHRAAEPRDPLAFADQQHVMRLRMVAGAAAGVALAPDILSQLCTVTDDTSADVAGTRRVPSTGPGAVRIVLKGKYQGSLRVVLRDDGKTPHTVTFDIDDTQGTLVFRGWRTNTLAHEAMFDPPRGLPEREVNGEDLCRIFASMFNFAMENAE